MVATTSLKQLLKSAKLLLKQRGIRYTISAGIKYTFLQLLQLTLGQVPEKLVVITSGFLLNEYSKNITSLL